MKTKHIIIVAAVVLLVIAVTLTIFAFIISSAEEYSRAPL